ncbi:MAG: hypothetical protein HKN26_12570 [Acidimicrobiales bacterium]|nr:hypothetical protein [Acidimicrobiales bacterium]
MTAVVDRPDRASEAEPDQRTRTPSWLRSLWLHAFGLLVVLVALLPLIGADSVFSADEGAAMIQVDVLDRTGRWSEASPFPLVDPQGERFGVHLSHQLDDGTFTYFGRRPAYTLALLAAAQLGLGLAGAVGLSILGTVAAASAAAHLTRHWRPNLDWVVLWVTGLLSPLAFNSYWVIAHALAAGAVGWALVFLFGRRDRDPSRRATLAGGVLLLAAGMVRSEAVLFAIALAVAFLVVDLGLERTPRPRFVIAGLAAAGGLLLNRLLASTLVGTIVGGASGIPSTESFGFFDGRVNALKATVLRVSPGGSQPIDFLLVLGIAVAAIGVVANRREPNARLFGRLAVVGASLAAARFALDRETVVPGLAMAFPLLPIGVVALRPRHVAKPVGRIVALTSILFAGAVLLTQYDQGGTAEFGGRYFAVMLPALVPVLVVALADVGSAAPVDARVAWRVGVGVMAAATVSMGLFGLHASKARVSQLVAAERSAVQTVMAETGEPAVVLSTVNAVSRWSWDLYADTRWLIVAEEDLAATATSLDRAGVSKFVVVGWGIDPDVTETLGAFERSDRTVAWAGSPWSVSIYAGGAA